MLCVPQKRELPIIAVGDEPPKLKSVKPLAETLMAHVLRSPLPIKYSDLSLGIITDIFSRLIGISPAMHMIVREGIRPFFNDKTLSHGNVFRALMYTVANASELKIGNVVPCIQSGLKPNTMLWQLIQTTDIKHISTTDRGALYSVSFLILTAPLAGSIFSCKISGKQIKRLIRDNSSCKYDTSVIPEFLFGYRLMASVKNTHNGVIIQTTYPTPSTTTYNVKIKKARLNCKKNISCVSCYKGVDKCRFAVKQTSWPLVVCPYCLKDAYAYNNYSTTCKCYKENYYDKE